MAPAAPYLPGMHRLRKIITVAVVVGLLGIGGDWTLGTLGRWHERGQCRSWTTVGGDGSTAALDACLRSRKAHRLDRWGFGHGHPGGD
jgi:hypothetical protein